MSRNNRSSERKNARTRSPETVSPGHNTPFVVGVGASAGGLEALERFFEHLPDGPTGMAFVIVQHLSPDHKSLMVDLLSKRTSLPVMQVEENTPVIADAVYVLPPGKTMVIRDGRLRLAQKDLRHGVQLTIDIFLNSLALDQAAMAAAVILSGTGSDGTSGVRSIHEQGGMVVVQTPETARFDGMPRSALDTGVVDEVLPPEEIGARLLAYVQQASPFPGNGTVEVPLLEGTADEVDRIIRVLLSQTGTDFSHYRRGTLMRRIERRMHLNQVENYTDYAVLLAASPHEAANLRKELLISVTAFFRDPQVFEDLRNLVITPLVAAAQNKTIRVWVCGCATGEEAYSMAMLLAEANMAAGTDLDIKIFATDIDRHALDFASNGVYAESTVADILPPLLDRYFTRQGDGYKVSQQLRRMVLFASHNVIKDPPFTKIDLVSCRNLLIYFEPELQQAVLARLQFALKIGSHLMLGGSETLGGMADSFAAVSGKGRIFRVLNAAALPFTGLSGALSGRGGSVHRSVRGVELAPKTASLVVEEATRALINHSCPPTLLVNEAFEMVHNFGGVERFLSMPTGDMSLDLLKHLPQGVSALVAATLHRVFREWREVHLQNIAMDTRTGPEIIQLALRPVNTANNKNRHVLLSFVSAAPGSDEVLAIDVDQAAHERIMALELELQHSRENQQTIIEELETTNEELQATNEELLSANEELQSANEELQSVNEELYTVNAELNEKVDELTRLTADLDNLMEATDIGIVFLDEVGIIRRFTPAAVAVIGLMERDLGRPIFDLGVNLDYPELFDDIRGVLANGQPLEKEASCTDGRTLLIRIHPYRADLGRASGSILTFVDVSPLKGAQRRLQMYLNSLSYEVAVLDHDGKVILVNSAWGHFAEINGIPREKAVIGRDYFDLFRNGAQTQGAAAKATRDGLRDILTGDSLHYSMEYHCGPEDDGRWFLINAGPTEGGGAVVSHMDITTRKHNEEQLRLAASVFNSSGEAILITDRNEKIISVNPTFCEITGYAASDVLGQTPRMLASGRHDSEFYQKLWEQLMSRGVWRGEVWNRRHNGQIYPEWLTVSTVRDEQGEITNYVAVFADISDRKAWEQRLLEINAELEQFAYVASHDLREPLRMVNSYLTLIERRLSAELDEETKDFMKFAKDGAKRMDSLILHLLEYSRIGRMDDRRTSVPLSVIIENATQLLRPQMTSLGAELTVEGGDILLHVHENDSVRLFQNVVANALKYHAENVVPRVSVTAVVSGEFALVAVVDNGIGIAAEHHDRVFRMFQRLHGRDDFGGGTGIGLAVCKKIVENHGGRMWIESRVDEGATFFFTLPLAP